MFTENVLTWLRILAIRFSVNRLLYFWQWTSFRWDYKKQTLMLMSKSHLFLYFLLCHFLKFSLKLLNLVISRTIFSGCELAAGQARKEMIISNFNRCQTASNSSTFSVCAICMPLPFVWESDHQRAANFQENERIEPMIFRWMLSKHRSSMCRNFWSVKISEDFLLLWSGTS